MKRNQVKSLPRSWRWSCERVSKRLDALAERDGEHPNAQKIRLLRRIMFEDVDALEQSGEVKLPE